MKKGLRFVVLAIFAMTILVGCNSDLYPRPTNDYYVNDYANVLSDAVEDTIVGEGERLYEDSQVEEYGGAQIVFATFAVETEDDIANYDKTTLFRKWGIGDNDMGILVIYFFVQDGENLTLSEVQIEVGYRMEQYLTPSQAGAILDDTILIDESIEIGTAHLLYELLTVVYVEAYGYDSFDYDMEAYQNYLDSYVPSEEDDSSIPMDYFVYLFSPYSSWGMKIFSILALFLVFGLGGGIVKNIGGGGSSGGMGVRRRR